MRGLYIMFLSIFICSSLLGQTRRMDAAMASRNYVSMTDRNTVQPYFQLAENQMRALQLQDAFLTIENALSQNPYSAELLMLRSRCNALMGFETEALKDIAKAKEINPYIANVYGNFTSGGLQHILFMEPQRGLLNLSNYKKVGYYYAVLDELSIVEDANVDISILENILFHIESDRFDLALEQVNNQLAEKENSYLLLDLKSVILREAGNYKAAEKLVLKSLELNPDFALAHFNYGEILLALGYPNMALTSFDHAIAIDPSQSKAYFNRALVLKKQGKLEQALADYNKIIDLKGKDYLEAYVNRGLTKKMMGDLGGALADLNIVIEQFPQNFELLKNRGNIYLLNGLPAKALDDYTKALTLNNTYAEIYFNRALAHYQLFDRISGCYDLEKSIEHGYEEAQEVLNYFCNHE